MKRRILTGVSVLALMAAAPAGLAYANEAAIDEIDHVVHEWEDGDITAEVALEEIDHIIHDLSADERTGVLAEIDDVVHAWDDGEMSAEDAMRAIEGLVHSYADDEHADDEHGDEEHGDEAEPAKVGNAGLAGGGSSMNLLLVLGGAGLMVALLGAGRVATARERS